MFLGMLLLPASFQITKHFCPYALNESFVTYSVFLYMVWNVVLILFIQQFGLESHMNVQKVRQEWLRLN